jgi:hypothetical protein
MRFSIKSKFLAAARIQRERREDEYRQSDVNDIQHNCPSKGKRRRDERNNAAIFILG